MLNQEERRQMARDIEHENKEWRKLNQRKEPPYEFGLGFVIGVLLAIFVAYIIRILN